MILTEFAPNEELDDALLSLKLLFSPWKWNREDGKYKIFDYFQKIYKNCKLDFKSNLFFNGRIGLYYLIKELNLPKNSQIIVQAFTCEAVILPILANNCKPTYIDIEKDNYSMDIDDLQKKITKDSKMIIIQHSFGALPKHRKQIFKIARDNNLFILEDLAHSIPSRKAICNLYTDITIPKNNYAFLYSFGRSKALSSVFGCLLGSNNYNIAEQLAKVEKRMKKPKWGFSIVLLLYKPISYLIKKGYKMNVFLGKMLFVLFNGLNLIIKEITKKEKRGKFDIIYDVSYPNYLSELLLNQIRKITKIENNRLKIQQKYSKLLKNHNNQIDINLALIRYPLKIKNRASLLKLAKKNDIILGKWYDQVVAPKEVELETMEYLKDSCQNAQEISEHIINLPVNISQKESNKIINFLNQYDKTLPSSRNK